MTWGLLDDKLHSHPKVVEAGNEAVGAWIRLVSYCCDHRKTQGLVPRFYALSVATVRVLGKCVQAGLLDVEQNTWRIHDFHDWSGSTTRPEDTPASLSLKRAEAGRKGAAKRWHGHSQEDGNCHADPLANGCQTDGELPIPKHGSSSSPIQEERSQQRLLQDRPREPEPREPPTDPGQDPQPAAREGFEFSRRDPESETRIIVNPAAPLLPRLTDREPNTNPPDIEERRAKQLREIANFDETPAAAAKAGARS